MKPNPLLHHSKSWDRTGVLIASLCLLHCLALPLLVGLTPAAHHFLNTPILEALILISGILVGSASFWTSYKKHRQWGPMGLGLIGISFLSWGLISDIHRPGHSAPIHDLSSFISTLEIPMLLGGLFMIGGHLWNQYVCHCFCDSGCSHHKHQQSHSNS